MQAFVIGNVTVDETIAIDDWPQPGASILGAQTARGLGGKGCNQAVVMARCGLPTSLVAATGDDFRAATIREQLSGEPAACRLILLEGRASDFSMILTTPDGENAIVTTTDCASHLAAAEACAALADATASDLAVLQGNLSDETTATTLKAARDKGLLTAFNPSPLRPYFGQLWPLIDIAFVNQGEARALTGVDGAEAARSLLAEGVRQVVVTLGGNGALLVDADGAVHVPGEACDVVDTTGAGDTFMAVALASAALRGTALDRRAIGDAVKAAAITVGRHGTHAAFPSRSELKAILAAG
ncbi:ribokinase [Nitratireductor sp. ZSWI3]|uniref:ribokinase n=1 Tax=Nitratireductor sp. ZSWI3 TaxID=2966359 RepID=UPI00214FF836|nr:ribokinase [Nitratireductor sp. ZSWI3]MCR4265108.1 ribokinase [Nitratireductor sp. ZSWI3]